MAACPNEAFRVGASANLPDCRAYELATPGASGQVFTDIESENPSFYQDLFPTEPVDPLGESLLFSTRGYGLSSPKAGGEVLTAEIYEARRTGAGWRAVRGVNPTPVEMVVPLPGGASSDHQYVFVQAGPSNSEKLGGDLGTLYIDRGADYLGDDEGHFELTGAGSLGTEQYAQGRYISPGGEHVIFTTGREPTGSYWCSLVKSLCKSKQLEPQAAPNGTDTIYDRSANGPTRVVSLLPNNTPQDAGEDAAYQGASASGTSVAFVVGGTLYVRVDNEKTEEVTAAPSTYGGFSAAGRYLFYASGGDIHRFDTADESDDALNATGDGAMMNVSADGSHVYFISPSQLDGSKGEAGKPNMYVWSGGAPKFVATVLQSDLESSSELDPTLVKWTAAVSSSSSIARRGPGVDASRATPDGAVAVFESAAQLTPYDNAGHVEVYRFKDGEGIDCVSCNPLAAQASKDARLQGLGETGPEIILHNLSDDGSRVFFETQEALVEGDIDGINDSYEWRESVGGNGPTLGLISSGHSLDLALAAFEGMEQNTLFAITPDGRDVFFKSQDALVGGVGVGGTQAIYDARVGGGFPESKPPPPCSEEGCKPPASPPPPVYTPASSSLQGTGNVAPKKKKKHTGKRRRCARNGKRRKGCHRKRAANASASSVLTSSAAALRPQGGNGATEQSAPSSTSAVAAAATRAAGSEYALKSVQAELSTYLAGQHPDFKVVYKFNTPKFDYSPKTEELVTKLPPGLYGNPNLIPHCSTGQFLGEACPLDSQVGVLRVTHGPGGLNSFTTPILNLAPAYPGREVARFGSTIVDSVGVFIDASVRTAGDYGVTATVHAAPSLIPLSTVEAVFWGDPLNPSHDDLRMKPPEAFQCSGHPCGGQQSPEDPGAVAFFNNPTACQPMSVAVEATSYQLPGQVFSREAPMDPIIGCQGLPFDTRLEARPTTDVAGAPTGLKTTIELPQSGDPSVPATAPMREARITFPPGMVINPSAADGLEACSDQQAHIHEEVDAQCPDPSKIGSLKIISPALAEPLEGAVYQRTPEPGHLFRLWLVADDFGLHVKIPGEAEPDPETGQLTAVFSDLPQVPAERIGVEIWGGARAPLRNPETCGVYRTTSALTPWSSDPAAQPSDAFAIDRSPSGPCTAGDPAQAGNPANTASLPFAPGYEAGTTTPIAGKFSPLVLHITRNDGEQQITSQRGNLPPGLIAKLAGAEYCPETALAAAGAKSGNEELASPSCPASSHIGSVFVGLGAGPAPFFRRGEVYLAPAYKGAPLSLAFITPAVAGPFDLGDVVVRDPLYIDPETALAHDAAELPTILQGIPLQIRDIRLAIDRPDFTLNPTNCNRLAFTAEIGGMGASLIDPSDDVSRQVTEPFQVGECARLGFKPKLKLTLRGGTKRSDYPSLESTLKARGGDANLGSATVALPHSEFIAQEHLVTICTRVQFAADSCPKGSVYGHVKAWTPLLDKPLEGPIYLRSSSNPLPDLVLDLRGQIEIAPVARIDSHRGGVRVSFEAVPDAPVSKVVLKMKGGKKGIFVNSTDICRGSHRATAKLKAQNGRRLELRPALVNRSCHKHHGHSRKHR